MQNVAEQFSVETDRVNPADWSRYLGHFADASIYQTWSYGAIRWGESNLSHLILKRGSEVCAVAQLRIARPPLLGSGVAYLRWGPLFQPAGQPADETLLRRFLAMLQSEYAVRQRLALRVLPNAFVGTARAGMFERAFLASGFRPAANEPVYRTLLVDLAPGLDEIRRRFDQKWRNQLKQAERNGLLVTEGTDAASWNRFEILYHGMMARKPFTTTVNIREFGAIQKVLPQNLKMRVLLACHEGEPVAGVACSFLGDTAIYLLGATHEKALKLRAANLLQWEAIKSAKQLGLLAYDLGGIDPAANPGGYHFKNGLSGKDVSHLPAFDCYRSAGQRLFLSTTFKAAHALRAWRVRRNQTAVAVK